MRILVVDDDPFAGELTAALLEDAGHEPVIAGNGPDALDKLSADPGIALIVSDLNMPLISGIELFRELRAQGVALPFILLTGDDPEGPRRAEPGLDACLIKDAALEDRLPEAVARVTARGMRP